MGISCYEFVRSPFNKVSVAEVYVFYKSDSGYKDWFHGRVEFISPCESDRPTSPRSLSFHHHQAKMPSAAFSKGVMSRLREGWFNGRPHYTEQPPQSSRGLSRLVSLVLPAILLLTTLLRSSNNVDLWRKQSIYQVQR